MIAPTELFIGVMLGTSLDGIDTVLVNTTAKPHIVDHYYQAYDPKLKQLLLALCAPGADEIERMAVADKQVAELVAATVDKLLDQSNTVRRDVTAIGSHGQTIRHAPARYSLQIGDPNHIAYLTGITTVADFRRKDIAAGGQGAPFAPAFHRAVFADTVKSRAIVNIGGMANITVLVPNHPSIGYDTGPGNVLLDAWIQQQCGKTYDDNGTWARQGEVDEELLATLLAHDYFAQPFPKSTGREQFNLNWLAQRLADSKLAPVDVQRTLTELSAASICDAIKEHGALDETYICGGGAYNALLMDRLQELLPGNIVATTSALGITPNLVEASAFAWFAQQTLLRTPVDLCSITGASKASVLGGVYYP
ncbi:MAG: anhydro-N-acetylmuramic acid kinase [Pseudomonadales bacterium]